jgi:hypothetical protein
LSARYRSGEHAHARERQEKQRGGVLAWARSEAV